MKMIVLVVVVVIVGIVSAAFVADYLFLPKTSTPKGRVMLDIISYNSYVEGGGVDFYVTAGEVSNNFSENVKSIRINLTYYNEEGYIVGYSDCPPELEILKPDQKAPFRAYTTLESLEEIPIRAELSSDGLVVDEQPIEGIDIAVESDGIDGYGYYMITGELENNGPSKVSGLKVVSTYYDSKGDVLLVSHAYPDSSTLNVGDKSTFELSSRPHLIDPSSYKLLVVASYEPIFDMRYPLFFAFVIIVVAYILYMKRYKGW